MHYDYKLITPDIARELLKKNDRNRHLSETAVEKLADLMRSDSWKPTGHTIQIYEDGQLADGQTRLSAIIKSNRSFPFLIVYGIPLESALGIDANRPRSVTDIARISENNRWFNNTKVAMIRFLYLVKYKDKMFSATVMLELLKNFPEAEERIDFAYNSLTKSKGFGSAPFLCALATAYKYEDENRLLEFCNILNSGKYSNDVDSAAMRIREYGRENKVHGSFTERKIYFLRSQNAIKAFCEYRKMRRLLPVKDLIYPIFI
jgi:hypothetical protein